MSIIKWVDSNAEKALGERFVGDDCFADFCKCFHALHHECFAFLGGRAYPLAVCLVRLVGRQLCVSHRRSRADHGAARSIQCAHPALCRCGDWSLRSCLPFCSNF